LTDQAAFAVIEESFWNTGDAEPLHYLVARIDEQRKADPLLGCVLPKIGYLIAGDRKDHQTLRPESPI